MYSDTVECPYCGYDNDMSDGFVDLPDDNTFDHECENCGEEFEVYVEFEPSYTDSKIKYTVCDVCGKETRDIYDSNRTYPFPKEIIDKKVCRNCYYKYIHKEQCNK